MIGAMVDEDHPAACDHCGVVHLIPSDCKYNIHDDDPFKSGCAVCGDEIGPGEPRESDKFNNIYCSSPCMARGLEQLIEEAT